MSSKETTIKLRTAFRELNYQWTIENIDYLIETHQLITSQCLKLEDINKGFHLSYYGSGRNFIRIKSEDCPELRNCLMTIYTIDEHNVKKLASYVCNEVQNDMFIREYKLVNPPRDDNGDINIYFCVKYLSSTSAEEEAASSSVTTNNHHEDMQISSPTIDRFHRRVYCVENFQKVFEHQELCDARIRIGSSDEIRAHSIVLAVASPFFMAALKHKSKSSDRLVDLTQDPDVTLENFKALLDYIYGCKSVAELGELTCELLVLADKFDIPELKESCETHLANKLNDSDVIRMLSFADKYGCANLKRKAISFAKAHKDAVKNSPDFGELCKHPNLVIDLLW